MAIFTIGDLHLSLGTNKPMDIFKGWGEYVQKTKTNWLQNITDEDVIVIAGDISWAMHLSECVLDFTFLNNLPGKKIFIKGNHDYWWSTAAKMKKFFAQHNLTTLNIMNNNCFIVGNTALCGTRSWLCEDNFSLEDEKIMARENGRLLASLQDAKNKNASEIIVFLHYPPIAQNALAKDIINSMREYGVKHCYYGHLHGASINNAVQGEVNGINYKLISADALKFNPYKIKI